MDAVADQSLTDAPAGPSGVHFALATRADDADIRRLLRDNPMPGRICISLEREPDSFIAAAVEGDVHHTIVAREPGAGRIIAMGSIAMRDAYLNGRIARVGYLGQLRLDRPHRSRTSVIRAGYQMFRELHATIGAEIYFTSIAADNAPARRLLERGLPGMPRYRPIDALVTSVISMQTLRSRGAAGIKLETAGPERIDEVLDCLHRNGRRYQFSPAWGEIALVDWINRGELELTVATRGGRIVGCIGAWDQSAYKQAVIRGYSPALARWRRAINLVSPLLRTPRLPVVGSRIVMAYLSHLAVDDDDPEVFRALLGRSCTSVCSGDRQRYLALGLARRHPLLAAIPRTLRRRIYETNLYSVSWDDSGAGELLDGRPCQPEVALL